MMKTSPQTVSVLVSSGMSPFESSIPIEVFGYPRPELAYPGYDLSICAERPGPLAVLGGATFKAPHGLDRFAAADTVIVPGVADVKAKVSDEVVLALRSAHARGARVVAICSGAFALAAAGLLDGRRATTHWLFADELQRQYPQIDVDPDVLYADEGQVITGAGSAAGLDLCLYLVRQDYGAEVANGVARRLVISPHRDGGQAQLTESPIQSGAAEDDRLQRSTRWALSHLSEVITLARLAEQAFMSPRSYARHFARAYGTSPIRWLIHQRVNASLPLLERTDMTVEEVARSCGFDSATTFRQHFGRTLKTSPTAYRRTFARPPEHRSSHRL